MSRGVPFVRAWSSMRTGSGSMHRSLTDARAPREAIAVAPDRTESQRTLDGTMALQLGLPYFTAR